MKRIAILQSNYIPWIGYFDLIRSVDQFVILDHVQYTERGWRNRNKIKTPEGVQWLTLPLGRQHRIPINEVTLPATDWNELHWKTLQANYSKAEHFKEIGSEIKSILFKKSKYLYELNYDLIALACDVLKIKTPLLSSSELGIDYSSLRKSDMLLEICQTLNANSYVSGPAAQVYLDRDLFLKNGISTEYFSYPDYPQYQQLWGDYSPALSIVDPLFNLGSDAQTLFVSEVAPARELAHAG